MARGAGRRRADPATRVIDAEINAVPAEPPKTIDALADLARLIGRSRAPQLKTRLITASS